MSTFRGGSIDDKPATLKRNEKWVRNIFAGKPLTIPQAKAMIGLYIEKMYGLTPHTGIGGRKPFVVFHEAVIPAEQQIDLTQLNFLMLAATDRVVQASGVRFSNIHFWHDELIQHIGDIVKASAENETIQEERKSGEDEELNFEELMKAIGIG